MSARDEAMAFIYDCPLCKVAVDLNNPANVYDEEADEAVHAECVEALAEKRAEAWWTSRNESLAETGGYRL